MDALSALKLAADPNKSTRVTIDAAKEALNNLWWVAYCELENLKLE